MEKLHHYQLRIEWKGNSGAGTANYTAYSRDHELQVENKPAIGCSSDKAFRGNPQRHNPEELFIASLSSCHMLWYLHLCSTNGIVVTAYQDNAEGALIEFENGSGKIKEVVLHPVVTVEEASMVSTAEKLHDEAHKMCFIANSCSIPILHNPTTLFQKEKGQ